MVTTLDKLSGIEQKAYFLFEEKNQRVIKLEEVAQALGISRRYASKVLHILTKKNAFEKVKSGLYIRFPASIVINKGFYQEDPICIACILQEPYFLSYYTALRIHGLSQHITKVFYVSNLAKSERINYHENKIQLVRLTPPRFFGITREEYSGQELSVSDLERTLLDVINRPEYSGGWPAIKSRICFESTSSGEGREAKNSAICSGFACAALAAWSIPSIEITNLLPSSCPRTSANRRT